jgi:hypothetical protein
MTNSTHSASRSLAERRMAANRPHQREPSLWILCFSYAAVSPLSASSDAVRAVTSMNSGGVRAAQSAVSRNSWQV